MVVGINGNYPGEHIAAGHVTGKIGPRQQPKKGFLARVFGCGLLLLAGLGVAALGVAELTAAVYGRWS